MLKPFVTEAPVEIFKQLGINDKSLQEWDSIYEQGNIPAGTKTAKAKPIFPRLEMEKEIETIKKMMKGPSVEKKESDFKDEIVYDDFMKLDLRVAEIVDASKMENADKLLRLQVDLGSEKRQIISGIAEHYKPGDLVGKKVIVVANLKPVKLRGQLSEGMILTGESPDGKLSLTTVEESLPNGSIVE